MEIQFSKVTPEQDGGSEWQGEIVDFLHQHLDRFRDSKRDINECLNYVRHPQRGGHIFLARDQEGLLGVTIVLNTNMKHFVPEYLLVYIAVDQRARGQGIGKKLINMAQEQLQGAIALHVEHDNPAKRLYEREGFSSKYAEMRYRPSID